MAEFRSRVAQVKSQAVSKARKAIFATAFHRLQHSKAAMPHPSLLRTLVTGWGNSAWSAQPEYLQEAIRQRRAALGPSIECGSGLSTLVVGAVGRQIGATHVALEHDAGWCRLVREAADRWALDNVTVIHAPLRDYGTCEWYDVTPETLPSNISLVLCDGPPGNTKGGRYGLLPIIRSRLAPGAVILVDDLERVQEQQMIAQWCTEFGAVITRRQGRKPYAIVRAPLSSLAGQVPVGIESAESLRQRDSA